MDDREIIRFVEAVALGEIVDRTFDGLCKRLGLPRWHGCVSPIDYVTMTRDVGTARRDQ